MRSVWISRCNAVTPAASGAYVMVKKRFYRSWPLAVLALGLLSGCVAHGTAGDQGAVRHLVRERTQLDLKPPRLPAGNLDADAQRLLTAPLTLDSAVRIALLNNRELRAELVGLGV